MPPPSPPKENFLISGLLRLFLVYSWGEIAKAAEAAKQLVIHVKSGKISVLITDCISLSLAAEGTMHE